MLNVNWVKRTFVHQKAFIPTFNPVFLISIISEFSTCPQIEIVNGYWKTGGVERFRIYKFGTAKSINTLKINPIPRCLWANLFHVRGGSFSPPPLTSSFLKRDTWNLVTMSILDFEKLLCAPCPIFDQTTGFFVEFR